LIHRFIETIVKAVKIPAMRRDNALSDGARGTRGAFEIALDTIPS